MKIPRFLYSLCLMLLLAACQDQTAEGELPTLAVLPTLPAETLINSAPILNFWEAVSGHLDTPDAVDYWQFSGNVGDSVSVRVLGNVAVTVTSPSGLVISTGTEVRLIIGETGFYAVQVALTQGERGAYELGLSYTDRPDPALATATPIPVIIGIPTPTPAAGPQTLGLYMGELQPGATQGAQISAEDAPHVYTFSGEAGAYVTLRLTRESGTLDPRILLYSPDGIALAVDDNSGDNRNAQLRNILLPEEGQYSVLAAGNGTAGAYQLRLEVSERPLPITPTIIPQPSMTPVDLLLTPELALGSASQRLGDHMPVVGQLTRPEDVQRHSFHAEAEDLVTITVRPMEEGADLALMVELYGPSGQLILTATSRTSNANGAVLIPALRIPEAGPYLIFVMSENASMGEYLVSYGVGSSWRDVLKVKTDADIPYDGLLQEQGLRDIWTLFLHAGDVITAVASPTTNTLDPVLEFVAPDGSVLVMDDNGGGYPNAFIAQGVAEVTGVYQLRVTAANAASVGPYRLVWRYVNIAPTSTPEPARILLMHISDTLPQDQYQFFPFQGRAGQRVRIRVIAQPGSTLDPVAALLGPDGVLIAEGDDSERDMNPDFIAELSADGTYTIRVNGYLSAGPYDLIVDLLF